MVAYLLWAWVLGHIYGGPGTKEPGALMGFSLIANYSNKAVNGFEADKQCNSLCSYKETRQW